MKTKSKTSTASPRPAIHEHPDRADLLNVMLHLERGAFILATISDDEGEEEGTLYIAGKKFAINDPVLIKQVLEKLTLVEREVGEIIRNTVMGAVASERRAAYDAMKGGAS